jgi:diguanylate cyclase (GGDEF)-like protein
VNDSRDAQDAGDGENDHYVERLYEAVFGVPPDGLSRDQAFQNTYDALEQIRRFVRFLAEGDISEEFRMPGPIAGPLKSLRSSLKHITWQAKAIAAGDLSQRIDFLGEFSAAFNEMAERLDGTLSELRTRGQELSEANASLRAAQAELLEQATRDPLTGLLNRRSLAESWSAEAARAERNGEPITVLVVDLDDFKSINDTCGHECGDIALVAFAETLTRALRESDVACRLGGDEFAVLLPGTSPDDGAHIANRIREAFECADLGPSLADVVHTASIGAASYPAAGRTLEAVLAAADAALYRAKASGRNRVTGPSE